MAPSPAKPSKDAAAQSEQSQFWVWAFALLLPLRLLSAASAPITDCDETFNYWEPLRYVSYQGAGGGMQTWEYSPVYALRSYLYIELHGLFLRAGRALLALDDVQSFYWLRSGLAALCAGSEAAFCAAVSCSLGPRAGVLTLAFLAPASGMFHASVALLPSTTCMYCVLLGFAAWLRGRHALGLMCGSFAVLLSWPFVALAFVPMGLDALRPGALGLAGVVGVAVAAILAFGCLPAVFDGWFYGTGRPVSAVANLIFYNALGQGGGGHGADLYGTEPFSFYVKNLLLNFNIVAPLGLLAGPTLAVIPGEGRWRRLLAVSPMYLVLLLFGSMAHKEERFLTPIYPLLCLSAAAMLDTALGAAERGAAACGLSRRAPARTCCNSLLVLAALAAGTLSTSRSMALYVNFRAPLRLYEHLYHSSGPVAPPRAGSVCIGKEWYRFPSSFFLPRWGPGGTVSPLLWLNSSFTGQLPRPFEPWPGGLSVVPPHMNDRNAEEPSRYSPLSDCAFVVDLELPGQRERPLDREAWEPLACEPFLDAERSRLPWRAFHLPFGISQRRNTYAEYCVWRRKGQ